MRDAQPRHGDQTRKLGEYDNRITIAALAVTAGVAAAHHATSKGGGSVDTIKDLATSDLARSVAFGAVGGMIVSVFSRAGVTEVLGRIFVGSALAATLAPWISEVVLKVAPTSTAYPVLSCTIGILGYQIVQKMIHDPSAIPVIGPLLGKMVGIPDPAPHGGHRGPEAAAAPDIAKTPETPASGEPRASCGPFQTWSPPPANSRPRVPLAR
jgi:hypothetical protein